MNASITNMGEKNSGETIRIKFFNTIQAGKDEVIARMQEKLRASSTRPQVLLINGYAGVGKSYFSSLMHDAFQAQGIKSIFIDTDHYSENPDEAWYSHDDFFQQKKAWEDGKAFEYCNPITGKRVQYEGGRIDIIIIGGVAADGDLMGISSPLNVFLTSPFLVRLANKCLRDHIVNVKTPSVETFMDEICSPEDDRDLLNHLASETDILSDKESSADIIISNTPTDEVAAFSLVNGFLIFRASFGGVDYYSERKVSEDRRKILEELIGMPRDEDSQFSAERIEAIRRSLGL